MAKKMPRSLVALSSSAIAAVYLAGYLATQSADAGLSGNTRTAASSLAAVVPTRSLTGVQPSTGATQPSTGTLPSSSALSTAAYRDGTYTGSGTSRRGGVTVSVTIQNGRITDVTITNATTQYPVSRIKALPGQVVALQSAQVDRVTGATYSAQAFQGAVQQALAQAQGTISPGTTTPAPSAVPSSPSLSPNSPVVPGRGGQGQQGRPRFNRG
jgi:uncharacterized protein with FMN-binding domain